MPKRDISLCSNGHPGMYGEEIKASKKFLFLVSMTEEGINSFRSSTEVRNPKNAGFLLRLVADKQCVQQKGKGFILFGNETGPR